ncbi:MAG: NAD-dependent succinate-semialdehyde dehydrogenase [Rhizobiaceae bacterium]|nr:NAD-dependent succinate-semialdehyde dehydrogenase [Rhizobiaceae bacterium]
MHSTYPDTLLHIAGTWCPSKSGRTLDVLNPATGETIGAVSHADKSDMDLALAAADNAFRVWRAMSAYERSQIMRRAAANIRERREKIAGLMMLEQGKPIAEAMAEVGLAADVAEWFAEEGRRAYGRIIPSRSPAVTQMSLRQPIGPVAAFTPWNFPVNQVVRKVCAALSAGCSIVVKAAEETPASPAALIGAFVDAGLPAGVLNLLYGNPSEISEYLIASPIIRKVSFTGSTPIGKHLASLAGQHMKPATMELGGHAPAIVTADANIDQAVAVLGAAKFRNAGQVCVAPTRFLIEKAAYSRFVEEFAGFAGNLVVGDGSDTRTTMGPLANERRIFALTALIEDAVNQGAQVVTGGRRIGNRGFFFEPTILANVPTHARIMNEEPFGPVAIANSFDSVSDALAEANRLPFGLASYAFTGSEDVAHLLRRDIEAGMLTINHNGIGLPEVPFGGIKESGYGSEGGAEAIEPYLVTRLVSQAYRQ